MKKDKLKKLKNKISHRNKKNKLEIYGQLIHKKVGCDTVDFEEVYNTPNIPGECAGDC